MQFAQNSSEEKINLKGAFPVRYLLYCGTCFRYRSVQVRVRLAPISDYLKWRLAGEALEDDGAQGPEVGLRIVLQGHDHLRGLKIFSVREEINQCFGSDPDPAFQVNTDPDPASDSDPGFFVTKKLEIFLYK